MGVYRCQLWERRGDQEGEEWVRVLKWRGSYQLGQQQQDVVALSSTEAEYMAMGHAVQEGL